MRPHRCRQLLCLLALPLLSAAQAAMVPGTVEVDLVFPRNETYAPLPGMPIVFAVQNSRLAASLFPGFDVSLYQLGNGQDESYSTSFALVNGEGNFSGSDPYFLYWSTNHLNHTEGTWALKWELITLNCTKNATSRPYIGEFGQVLYTQLIFTTKNGGKQFDLAAATTDDSCANSPSYAFNVTEVLPYVPSANAPPADGTHGPLLHRNSCAILSPTPPTSQPCRVKIDAAAASSIAANLSCRGWNGCPSSGPAQFRVTGAAWLIAAFPVVYLLL